MLLLDTLLLFATIYIIKYLSNISADGHLDSVEDTIPGHSGQPRIEVREGR